MEKLVNLINHDDVIDYLKKFSEYLNSIDHYTYWNIVSKNIMGKLLSITGYVPCELYVLVDNSYSLRVWDHELKIQLTHDGIRSEVKQI